MSEIKLLELQLDRLEADQRLEGPNYWNCREMSIVQDRLVRLLKPQLVKRPANG